MQLATQLFYWWTSATAALSLEPTIVFRVPPDPVTFRVPADPIEDAPLEPTTFRVRGQ